MKNATKEAKTVLNSFHLTQTSYINGHYTNEPIWVGVVSLTTKGVDGSLEQTFNCSDTMVDQIMDLIQQDIVEQATRHAMSIAKTMIDSIRAGRQLVAPVETTPSEMSDNETCNGETNDEGTNENA